jgi:hypothetical protein
VEGGLPRGGDRIAGLASTVHSVCWRLLTVKRPDPVEAAAATPGRAPGRRGCGAGHPLGQAGASSCGQRRDTCQRLHVRYALTRPAQFGMEGDPAHRGSGNRSGVVDFSRRCFSGSESGHGSAARSARGCGSKPTSARRGSAPSFNPRSHPRQPVPRGSKRLSKTAPRFSRSVSRSATSGSRDSPDWIPRASWCAQRSRCEMVPRCAGGMTGHGTTA